MVFIESNKTQKDLSQIQMSEWLLKQNSKQIQY